MEWLNLIFDFVTEILKYIAWPIFALFLLFVFKEPLTDLIDRLKEYERRHGIFRFGETKEPLSQPINTEEMPTVLSQEAKKILTTLWERQTHYFKEDYSKRWSFRILPNAQSYSEFIIGFAELLKSGLVGWMKKDDQALLTERELEYIKKHVDIQTSEDRYIF